MFVNFINCIPKLCDSSYSEWQMSKFWQIYKFSDLLWLISFILSLIFCFFKAFSEINKIFIDYALVKWKPQLTTVHANVMFNLFVRLICRVYYKQCLPNLESQKRFFSHRRVLYSFTWIAYLSVTINQISNIFFLSKMLIFGNPSSHLLVKTSKKSCNRWIPIQEISPKKR